MLLFWKYTNMPGYLLAFRAILEPCRWFEGVFRWNLDCWDHNTAGLLRE